MLTHPEKGTIDLLVKVVGDGTRELRDREVGEILPMLGPIGRPFDLSDTARTLCDDWRWCRYSTNDFCRGRIERSGGYGGLCRFGSRISVCAEALTIPFARRWR